MEIILKYGSVVGEKCLGFYKKKISLSIFYFNIILTVK